MSNVELVSKTVPEYSYFKSKLDDLVTQDEIGWEEASKLLDNLSPEQLMIFIARVSSNRDNKFEEYKGLLNYLIDESHWSPFQMADMTVEIKTSRAIGRQLIRHRSFKFQEFCVSEGTEISCIIPSGKTSRRTIEELYKLQNDPRWSRLIRVYDKEKKELVSAKVKEVFKTGEKNVFSLKVSDSKTIKTTKDHKFLTRDGFKELGELSEGDVIAANGEPVYRDKEWLLDAKKQAIKNGTGVQGIADKAECSYHTIRKWLAKHNITFTKKEVASYTDTWNEGLPAEEQPMYGKTHDSETREKMKESARHGKESNLYIDGSSEDRSFRQKVWDWQCKYKNYLLKRDGKKCNQCDSTQNLEIDHIKPVSQFPELAMDLENLQILCSKCHNEKTRSESKKTVKWVVIETIEEVGFETTYDLEVDHVDHNYVANGLITHNSQRYSSDIEFESIELREQPEKNRQSSSDWIGEAKSTPSYMIDDDHLDTKLEGDVAYLSSLMNEIQSLYNDLIDAGVASETARMILPECTRTTLYMKGSVRSWATYLDLRSKENTQKEHREVANEIGKIFQQEFPVTSKALEFNYE